MSDGICKYEHHKEHGKTITCPTCQHPLECGPFEHGCRVCEPAKFVRCLICYAERVYCCC